MKSLFARFNTLRLWRVPVRVKGNVFRPPTLDRLVALALFRAGLMGGEDFRMFRKLLRPGMTIVDIGANQGVFTLHCADLVGPTGRVIAFEPDPEMFAALQANVQASDKSWVDLHNLAVGAVEGRLTFQASAFNRGDNRLVAGSVPAQAGATVVQVITLDRMVEGRKVDFIKMDVQGWEAGVLRGMKRLLSGPDAPVILLELCPDVLKRAGSSVAEVTGILLEHGYSLRMADERQEPLDVEKVARMKGTFGFTDALALPPGAAGPK